MSLDEDWEVCRKVAALLTNGDSSLRLPLDFVADVGTMFDAVASYSPFTLTQRAVALGRKIIEHNEKEPVVTDYSVSLEDYLVSVRMVRQPPDAEPEYRDFAAVVPAASAEEAQRSATDIGYAVGTASGWQWKFTSGNSGLQVVAVKDVPVLDPSILES